MARVGEVRGCDRREGNVLLAQSEVGEGPLVKGAFDGDRAGGVLVEHRDVRLDRRPRCRHAQRASVLAQVVGVLSCRRQLRPPHTEAEGPRATRGGSRRPATPRSTIRPTVSQSMPIKRGDRRVGGLPGCRAGLLGCGRDRRVKGRLADHLEERGRGCRDHSGRPAELTLAFSPCSNSRCSRSIRGPDRHVRDEQERAREEIRRFFERYRAASSPRSSG